MRLITRLGTMLSIAVVAARIGKMYRALAPEALLGGAHDLPSRAPPQDREPAVSATTGREAVLRSLAWCRRPRTSALTDISYIES